MNHIQALQTWNAATSKAIGTDAEGDSVYDLSRFGLIVLGVGIETQLDVDRADCTAEYNATHAKERSDAARFLREWADAIAPIECLPKPPEIPADVQALSMGDDGGNAALNADEAARDYNPPVDGGPDVSTIENVLLLIWPFEFEETEEKFNLPFDVKSIIGSWDKETREKVLDWAGAIHADASDNEVEIPPVPDAIKPYWDKAMKGDAPPIHSPEPKAAPSHEHGEQNKWWIPGDKYPAKEHPAFDRFGVQCTCQWASAIHGDVCPEHGTPGTEWDAEICACGHKKEKHLHNALKMCLETGCDCTGFKKIKS